jgi:HAE1 family hydrophobic/amphiphilic exporter-1
VLTLFTTPVIYLYLDRLSNAVSGWGRLRNEDDDADLAGHEPAKQAAE